MTKIRIKYIDRFTDRIGVTRYYFRKPGEKRIPLPDQPGTPEFMKAYNELVAGSEPAKPNERKRGGEGTFDALIGLYYRSPEYLMMAESSRRAYKNVLERWLIDEKIGHRPVSGFKREHVTVMLGKRSATPGAANDLLKKIRLLMSFAIRNGMRTDDPTIKMRKYASGTFHTWTEDEIAKFEARWPVGTTERLAFALLLYTGQRRSDVVRMGWPDMRGQSILVTQQKTKTKLEISLHPSLRSILAECKKSHVSVLVNQLGRPFSAAGFGMWMADKIADAGLPDICVTHGLRKAAARRLAEAGCSASEIAAVTGHKSLAEVERYVKEADQRKLSVSGIARLAEHREK